jgi:hypothetical protein
MSRLDGIKAFYFRNNQKVVNVIGVVIVYFSTMNASKTGRKLEAQKIELDNVQLEFSYLKESLQADTWLQSLGSKLDKVSKLDKAKVLKKELSMVIEKSNAALISEEIMENKKNSAAGKSKSDDKMLNGILNGIAGSNGGRMM